MSNLAKHCDTQILDVFSIKDNFSGTCKAGSHLSSITLKINNNCLHVHFFYLFWSIDFKISTINSIK